MEMQQRFIDDVTRAVETDARVLAAWLEGSYGRGDADRFSDVDLHLLLAPATADDFRAGAEEWLGALRPLVLYRLMFDGAMINALDEEGLRLDIWLHVGEQAAIEPARAQVLFARGDVLHDKPPAAPPDPAALAAQLDGQIREFWRCIALVPVVAGREEHLVGFMGLNVEQGILVNVLLDGYGIARDAGVKKLNPFLPAELRNALEAALTMSDLSTRSLVTAHLALAKIMQAHGPIIAARHEFAYPQALEQSVLAYVDQELATLGLAART
ncbi:MAG: nucleotidyltransferase domain-containing protein [Caldilineaceae bacterium]|nr:nucleotidyltransferase domain-containing protein [Caldilineaceae bacterium]